MTRPKSIIIEAISILLLSSFLAIPFHTVFGQSGIQLNTPEAFDGYTLVDVGGNTFLLDNCGKIVNTWFNVFPSYHSKLTQDGNLIFLASNGIVFRDWDDNPINSILIDQPDLFLEYEVIPLKNGNYLALCRRLRSEAYFEDLGYSPDLPMPAQTDGVVEIDPDGNIVWEWNIGDHTIQELFQSASNFGLVSQHPERVNINKISPLDWTPPESFMINGMDYNEELDQIVLSARKLGEFLVIDHSTTTEEAAGSTGGRYGKGGDILYRWGNPQNYNRGEDTDQYLYFQHNPNWIHYGPHKGKFIVFSNNLTLAFPDFGFMSSVYIVNPPIDQDGNYEINDFDAFSPSAPDVTIDALTTGNYFYSGYTSGAVVLPNESIYISVGAQGILFELENDGTELWKYRVGDNKLIFRSEKYATDFPGFDGKDMTAEGTIENPPSPYQCDLFTSTAQETKEATFQFYFNQNSKILEIKNIDEHENTIEIFNANGSRIYFDRNSKKGSLMSLDFCAAGIYVIRYSENKTGRTTTKRIIISQ